MKLKNLIFISIILSSYLVMSFSFFDMASASSIIHPVTFEGFVAGTQYGDTYVYTVKTTGTFQVSSSGSRSGTRCFDMDQGSNGTYRFNLSGGVLTNISWFMDADTGWTVANSCWYGFYNSTYQTIRRYGTAQERKDNFMTLIQIGITGGGASFSYYYDENGNPQSISLINYYHSAGYDFFWFSWLDDIGNIRIGHSGYVWNGVCCNSTALNNGWKIDRMMYYSTSAVADNLKIDDMNITISDTYGGGTGACGIDLSAYDKLGIDNTPNSIDLNYPEFQKINYGLNYGYLQYITLCVNPAMYTLDPDPANYTLTCLGFNIGGADCFSLDGYNYRLIWTVGIDLGDRVEGIPSGRNIYCHFTHNKLLFGTTYWEVCCGSTIDTDLDSDGSTSFKLWNSARTVIDYDVGVSFYFDPTTRYEASSSTYTDSLGLQNYVSSNTTGFIYDINQPEGIVCSYLLSQTSSAYQNKIVVMKNTTTYYKNFTGLTFPSGVRGLLPNTIGKYTFKLYNYHYIYNITAWVTGVPAGYYISSDPTITNPYERYDIVYRYYNPLGYKGAIGVFADFTERGSYVYSNERFENIASNTSNRIPYNSLALTTEYLTLFSNVSYLSPVAYGVHWIRDNNVLENNIYVSPAELGVYQGNPDNYAVTIYGSHVFVGSQISIFINGREMFSVRDEQQFNKSFAPPNPDSYNISLRLYQNGSWKTIKYCYLTVSDLGASTPEGEGFSFNVPAPYSYFAGIFIIIVSTLSPLLIIGAVKHDFKLDTIPQFLYLVMAIVGFVITIIMGFFPAWTVLVVFLMSILVIVIMWQRSKITN